MNGNRYKALVILTLLLALIALLATAAEPRYTGTWVEPGAKGIFPASASFEDLTGELGVVNTGGPLEVKGHPFFTPLGTNGRACISCHQPAYGMSVSAASLRARWRDSAGEDPVFAAIDGSNCPNLPQDKESSHSLLLNRGLFRVFLPWPAKNVKPEFTIEVVRDPTGCNKDAVYGLHSGNPSISVFRRPRPAANLKYVTSDAGPFVLKTGMLADVDPETGRPVGMNMMSDAREPTLKTQAVNAALGHEQAAQAPTAEQLKQIVEFESAIYMAQIADRNAGNLDDDGAPEGLGPRAMANGKVRVLGDNDYLQVFKIFDAWKKPVARMPNMDLNRLAVMEAQQQYRASIARGNDIFMFRQFWLRDATHINSIGLGNPLKRTCATCHNAQMTGQDLSAGWVDLGTTNYPTWTELPLWNEASELPVFKITCDKNAPPHPYLGRVIYTTDPGRALISGKCVDVGSIVMQQLRGLAARAPYFSNGSAKTLRELVDFYDRRFDMKLAETEKQDLINFLGAL